MKAFSNEFKVEHFQVYDLVTVCFDYEATLNYFPCIKGVMDFSHIL
jgi:hypothetical protein